MNELLQEQVLLAQRLQAARLRHKERESFVQAFCASATLRDSLTPSETFPRKLNPGLGRVRPQIAGAILIGSLFLLSRLAWSQAGKPDQPAVVNLGFAATLAGDTVDIPIYLSAPETIKVVSIAKTISFPKKLLSLTKTELGLAGEQSQAEIKTSIADDPGNSGLSLLQLVISSKEPMKQGILAVLKFKVSTAARKGNIPLKVVDSKATAAGGAPLQMAKGKDGVIGVFDTIEEMPVTGCFFFTH